MLRCKRLFVIGIGLLCILCLAACGNAAGANSTSTSANGTTNDDNGKAAIASTTTAQKADQATQVPTTNKSDTQATGQNQNNGTQNPQSNGTGNTNTQPNGQAGTGQNTQNTGKNTLVRVIQTKVNGQMTNILANGTGLALYYRTSDPAPNSTCTADCAKTWPPFIAQGSLIMSQNFPGQLTIKSTANGNQVEYNGHPLYTYTGDNAPGEVNGQNVGNVWKTISVTTQKQHW